MINKKNFGIVCILILLLFGFFSVDAQTPFAISDGHITSRPVVKNNRVLWFSSRPDNRSIDRMSVYVYEAGNNKLITNDASVLFPGFPDMDDEGNIVYMRNMGRSHEVYLYDATTFQQIQITNNPAIGNSSIDMGLGTAKIYTGYARIHNGDIVFKNKLGNTYLYQSKAKSIRAISTRPDQTANLGDKHAEKKSTGIAAPVSAHVKYFEFDGKNIVWMHENRGTDNNSKITIYMAKASNKFRPQAIASFDAWVPNNKGVLPGKLFNPFFRACDGKIIWQYYTPSVTPSDVKKLKLMKVYRPDMDDVRVAYFDGKTVKEISRGTAVNFQSVRIGSEQAIWSQIRKEGEGKKVKKFREVISYSNGTLREVVSHPEPPKQANTGSVYWKSILDAEIIGKSVFWVADQTECFQQFKMPVTNESRCMYKDRRQVGFFYEGYSPFFPFLTMESFKFAGAGEINRGLFTYFSPKINPLTNPTAAALTRDLSAIQVVGDSADSSDSFLRIRDLKTPDEQRWKGDEPNRKKVTDAFSIDFDFIGECCESQKGANDTTIESITLDVSAEKSPTARLEDIKSIALYEDKNENGRLDASDKLLARKNSPVPAETIFTFSPGIKIKRDESKYFLVEMEMVEDVCPCGKYTVEILGEKLGIKTQAGGESPTVRGKTKGSIRMPVAKIKDILGDEQAGLPNQKLEKKLTIVYENLPIRCGKVKFKIETQPFEKGGVIISSKGETTDEVILDLVQDGKDALAEVEFRLGKTNGLYTIRASLVSEDGNDCDNEYYIFRVKAGKMILSVIDLNNPEYYTSVPDTSNPDFDTWKATMTSDIEKLAVGGQGRVGALADGASMLLVRIKLVGFRNPPPGNVNITISGDQNIGHLSKGLGEAIPSYDGGNSLAVKWRKTGTGVYGFALYTPPKNFGYTNAPHRNVNLKAVFELDGTSLTEETDLMLKKPPIAFIHTLWSSANTWESPYTIQNSQYETYFIDYSSLSSYSFAELSGELELGIRDITRNLRRRKIAATRLNVVGHGSGGLIARQFFADNRSKKFFRKDNFGKGDIYKLITLGTPHYGSPMAWLLVTTRDNQIFRILTLAKDWGQSINGGAVDAICPGSRELMTLGTTHIPTNTIRTWIYDSEVNSNSQYYMARLTLEMKRAWKDPDAASKFTPGRFVFELVKYAGKESAKSLLSSLYGAQKTDLLVTLEGQGGGITQGSSNVFDKTVHFDTKLDFSPLMYSQTKSQAVADHIFDTFNRDYDALDYFSPKIPAPIVPDPAISCSPTK